MQPTDSIRYLGIQVGHGSSLTTTWN
ncbi:TPA: hypothetical protein N0F65_012961 [Lagenidium giganteum]|uniref:Uncharacterized protein n=1 Tax=Lagenidium giganteum TaxID=4803 RepID=A0AAV2Z467_9STRA|nr:TPA: hypothetical protein N0F65_012961 [Lagenidium giganteum]